MKARDFFPLGVAEGEAFCNRVAETKWLLGNIENGKHSLLISPRRYGKTSLSYKAIKESKLANEQIDFSMATSDKKVATFIANGVANLIGRVAGPVDKTINLVKKYVSKITPKIVIKGGAMMLELDFSAESDPPLNVAASIKLLENILAERKKPAIMLLDEFQSVGVIAEGKGIEGAIRHEAQKTKLLTFIFSGSNRRLLKTMFSDETRPLYKLCKQLTVERIGYEDYQKHLNKAALMAWDKEIKEDVIKHIIALVEFHPYYVNKLCDIIWTEYNKPPNTDDVNRAWQLLLAEEKSDSIKEMSLLSIGQKKVLAMIAQGITSNLTSKTIATKLDMPPSSVFAAIQGLEEKDIIEEKNLRYYIINPMLSQWCRNITFSN